MSYTEDQLRAMVHSVIATARSDKRPDDQGVREATEVIMDLLLMAPVMALPDPFRDIEKEWMTI